MVMLRWDISLSHKALWQRKPKVILCVFEPLNLIWFSFICLYNPVSVPPNMQIVWKTNIDTITSELNISQNKWQYFLLTTFAWLIMLSLVSFRQTECIHKCVRK